MFEKSKSAITFKEFENKMNIVNNFENDWGHFYDPDNNNILFLDNLYLYPELQKPIQKDTQAPFIDIEKQEHSKPEKPEQKQEQKPEQKQEISNLKNYIYKINKITIFIETILTYIKTPLITFSMAYFILKVI